MKEEMTRIANKSDFKINMMQTDQDHLHLLVESTPSISLTAIVRRLKQESKVSVWKRYPDLLKKYFWSEKTFWTDGYFVSTIWKCF